MTTTGAGVRTGWARWKFLLTPFWIGAVLGSIVFALLCWLVLAPWQLGRHDERSDRNDAVVQALRMPGVEATELMSPGHAPVAAQWREVTATGTFVPGHEVAVRLRQDRDARPAAEMVLPFRLSDGTLLLVNRGYVSDALIAGGGWPDPPPGGEVTLRGRVQPDQPDPSGRAPVDQNGRTVVYGIDSAALLTLADPAAPHLQGFVQLTADSPGVLSPIGVPHLESGPFLSYGWQWLAFGLIAVLSVGYFVIREGMDPREDEDRTEQPPPDGAPAAATGEPGPAAGARVGDAERAGSADGPGDTPVSRRTEPAGRAPRRRFDKSDLYDP